MTDAARAHRWIIRPVLAELVDRYDKPALGTELAAKHLVAIGLQESGLVETVQLGPGRRPLAHLARGWWQFERGGGVVGVLRHRSTLWARDTIDRMGHSLHPETLHWSLAYDQKLAAAVARALLWTDPAPLSDDRDEAWALYLRTWRPGKPRPEKWGANWDLAGQVVNSEGAIA